MKRILIISHNVTRTGAPLVMLYLLRWLKSNHPEVVVDVLALKGGAVEEEFRSAADGYFELKMPPPPQRSVAVRAIRKGLRLIGLLPSPTAEEFKEQKLRELSSHGYDVVLANSLASIPVGVKLKQLAQRKPVLIGYVQEFHMVIRQLLPDLPKYVPHVDRFWAVSELGRANLIRNWGVEEQKVEVQYVTALVHTQQLRVLEMPPDEVFRVGAVGTVVMRKGYDLFIQVARWVRHHHPELKVHFTWVGNVGKYERPLIEHDLVHAGLEGIVEFVGELEDPTPVYRTLDVFLLPSREEPFGLVCIEAGTMGKPIVCFEGVTGAAEVLRHGGGVIVPYLDVEAMARAVVDYALDPGRRSAHGELNKVQFARLGTEEQCPLMWQRISRAWEEQGRKP